MLALVADVANYEKFLPWVKAVKIWNNETSQTSFDAELLIGYRNFRAPFATSVIIDRESSSIKTSLLKHKSKIRNLFAQPMRELICKWEFMDLKNGSLIDLRIDYQFNDRILAALLSNNLEKAIQKLIEAFTSEAKRRYS